MVRSAVAREVRTAGRAFIPTDSNSFREKALLISILAVWVALELGSAFYGAELPASMGTIRQIVFGLMFYTFGRVQGREVEREASRNG